MNNYTKSMLLLITYSIVWLAIVSWSQNTYPNGTKIITLEDAGITIIKPTEREIIFNENGTTASQLWFDHYASAVINAGYFGYTWDKKYMPAGIYTLGNTASRDVDIDPSHCRRDGNLCSFVDINSLGIHRWQDSLRWEIINSGPIMVMNGIINPDIYSSYSHRQRKTNRTILINTNNWPVFIITTKSYTLPQIAHYLLWLFGSNVSIINLDGWSSTSLWTSQTWQYFNDHKPLPTFFVLH